MRPKVIDRAQKALVIKGERAMKENDECRDGEVTNGWLHNDGEQGMCCVYVFVCSNQTKQSFTFEKCL